MKILGLIPNIIIKEVSYTYNNYAHVQLTTMYMYVHVYTTQCIVHVHVYIYMIELYQNLDIIFLI